MNKRKAIAALRRHAADGRLSGPRYERSRTPGEPSKAWIVREFGTWSEALRQARLRPVSGPGKLNSYNYAKRWSDEDCLQALRQVAEQLHAHDGKRLTGGEYEREAKRQGLPSRSLIRQRLGLWKEALQRAGLPVGRPPGRRSPDNGAAWELVVARLNAQVPELMGASEVARELGIFPTNLPKVVDLPEPVAVLDRGRIWRAEVIREFAERRRKAKDAA